MITFWGVWLLWRQNGTITRSLVPESVTSAREEADAQAAWLQRDLDRRTPVQKLGERYEVVEVPANHVEF